MIERDARSLQVSDNRLDVFEEEVEQQWQGRDLDLWFRGGQQ